MGVLRRWPRSTARAGRISLSGLCALSAVVAVVIVVSVPRLGRIALAENDSDARSTARFLAEALPALPVSRTAQGSAPQATRLLELPRVRRTLADARPDADAPGAVLHHGYLFEVVRPARSWSLLSTPVTWLAGAPLPGLAVLARPQHPAAGVRAYLAWPGGATYAAPAGAVPQDLAGWRRVD